MILERDVRLAVDPRRRRMRDEHKPSHDIRLVFACIDVCA